MKTLLLLTVVFIRAALLQAHGTFQNLDFESAKVSGGNFATTNALPVWTAFAVVKALGMTFTQQLSSIQMGFGDNPTNPVSVKVTDNGTPNLGATQNFFVTVNPLNAPMLNAVSLTNGQFNFQVSGDFGPDYTIQASPNLTDWSALFTTNSPALPFNWNDSEFTSWPARFYRVLLGP
jgi:hypothetical protein